MFFEIYSQDNLIIRGKETLNTFEFDHELNLAPSLTMELDGSWIPLIDGREEVKIYFDDGKVFWGIVWDFDADKEQETLTLDVRHVVTEWQYRQISVNHAMSNKELNIVYKGDKVEKENGETITASDFTVNLKKISKMKTKDWVEKAHASAWVTATGEKVKIIKVDYSDIDKKKGKYQEGNYKVKFSTAKGTSVTVECTVKAAIERKRQKTESSKSNKETIAATPITMPLSTAEHKDDDDVKKMVKAKAWVYRHKKDSVEVTSITTNYEPKVGTYTVTAKTAKGTSITVKVVVEPDDTTSWGEASVVDKLEDIFNDMNFAYPGWQIDFQDDSATRMIDYVYSKQNKLEALTQTVELTDDLWWRVGYWNEKKIEIGKFGKLKPYTISTKPSGKTNIRMITEPTIDADIENVINVATVYSDKSDGGMTSLTLREVYMDKQLLREGKIDKLIQKDGFPVVILRDGANNERNYPYIDQFPKLAPNNELEYAVIDEESVALEKGILIEGSYSFNDLSPFELDSKTITDKKRIRAAKTVYEATIRKLKQARRSYDITVTTEPLPKDVLVGDKIRLLYDNRLFQLDKCSNYWKKLLSMNDEYYITKISYIFDEYGNETNEVTLAKWLKTERETANTQG